MYIHVHCTMNVDEIVHLNIVSRGHVFIIYQKLKWEFFIQTWSKLMFFPLAKLKFKLEL